MNDEEYDQLAAIALLDDDAEAFGRLVGEVTGRLLWLAKELLTDD